MYYMKSLDGFFVFSLYLAACCINNFNINARCVHNNALWFQVVIKSKFTVLFLQNRLFQLLHQVKVSCGIAKRTQYDLLLISSNLLENCVLWCNIKPGLRAQDHASPVLWNLSPLVPWNCFCCVTDFLTPGRFHIIFLAGPGSSAKKIWVVDWLKL